MKDKQDELNKYIRSVFKTDPSLKREKRRADRAWNIAFQIRELRKKRGLTQAQLAKLVGISQPNIARIENADYQHYTLTTLEKITKALKADLGVVIIPEEKADYFEKQTLHPAFGI